MSVAVPWPTTGVVELHGERRCEQAGCGLPLPVLDVEEQQTKHASCGMPPWMGRKSTTQSTRSRRKRR